MSQDLNPGALSSLVILMCWASENHTFNTTPTEKLQQHPAVIARFFVKVVPGTTFTSWSKDYFVVIGKAEHQVRKTFHCCTKQQKRSHFVLMSFACLRHMSVVLHVHPTRGESHIHHNAS